MSVLQKWYKKEVSPDGTETYKNVKIQDKQLKTRAIELFGGITQDDEPVYCQLTQFSTLYHCNKYLQEILPKYFPYLNNSIYINLPGSGGQKFTMGVVNYEQYINIYQRNFKPSFFSYDCYPIRKAKLGVYLDDAYFYDTLEIFSNIKGITDENGAIRRIPFWAFYLGTGFTNKSLTNFHPSPTEAYLRITAFSALGYGAKGIKFDLYFQPEDFPSRIYYSAPINSKGDKTEIWNYVKNLNKEVKIFNNIFANSELIECMHTVNQYKGVTLYEPIFSFGPLMQIESSGIGFLMSHLFSNGIDYLVLVNHDVENAQYATLFFTEYWIINRIVMSVSGNLARLPVLRPQNGWRLEVPAGGYLIFEWR